MISSSLKFEVFGILQGFSPTFAISEQKLSSKFFKFNQIASGLLLGKV